MPSLPGSILAVQSWIAFVLGIAAVALQGYALFEALRYRADAYLAVGKLSKPVWCIILAVALALGVLSLANPLSLFEIIAVVAAGAFLAGTRPALRQVLGLDTTNSYRSW